MINNIHVGNRLTVLDCTFRDGGYYNQWDFDTPLVQKYLHAISVSGVNIVELGFRNFPQDKFLGAFAYTTDRYIDSLNISKSVSIGVMIDASSILNSGFSIEKAINILFQKKSKSRVDLVRIATHFQYIEQCKEIVQSLKDLGYSVGLNLMQPNFRSNKELSKVAGILQSWQMLDVLYFADSLGSMDSDDVIRIASGLRVNWVGDIGFHAHNNKGLAVSNTLASIDGEVNWVDGTILGMGRGAGNAQIENLLIELQKKHYRNYHADALFDLVLSEFTPLQNYYHWGEGLLYSLAATHDIHPSYIQEMLTDNRYNSKEILQTINFMSLLDTNHYDKDLLLHAQGEIHNKGSWNAKDWCLDREVLILGSGESLLKYQKAVIHYIESYRPVVISLNIGSNFPDDYVDVYVSSNEAKMLSECDLYTQLKKPLIISKLLLKKAINKHLEVQDLWDYGLNIKNGIFLINETECTLPYELSIGYALSLTSIGAANLVSLVGFDGYKSGDMRQSRMNELLDLYNRVSTTPVISLTPTTYTIKKGSVYAGKI